MLFFIIRVCCVKQLYKHFQVPGPPKGMGLGKEWNVDLIPKFMLSDGEMTLVQIFSIILYCLFTALFVHKFPVRRAVTCYRTTGEDAAGYRGDAVFGLQSHRGQLRF